MKKTMKAIRFHTHGGSEVLKYEDVPLPLIGSNEVLIRAYAVGFNPGDWRQRIGYTDIPKDHPHPHIQLPYIPGWDVSGVVEAIGRNVTSFQIGDEVYGMVRFPKNGATYAEYVSAPITHLAHKPRSVNHIQAAAIPMGSLTAWQALFEHGKLKAGQTVLITGASGGVGHFAVQLAKIKGAKVIGVASGRNKNFLSELGVDQFVDYTTTSVEQVAKNVDLVIDTVGRENGDSLLDVIKPGGKLVAIYLGNYSKEHASAVNVTMSYMEVYPDSNQLSEIIKLIDTKHVRAAVDTILPLTEAQKAHELFESRRIKGKIVLQVI